MEPNVTNSAIPLGKLADLMDRKTQRFAEFWMCNTARLTRCLLKDHQLQDAGALRVLIQYEVATRRRAQITRRLLGRWSKLNRQKQEGLIAEYMRANPTAESPVNQFVTGLYDEGI